MTAIELARMMTVKASKQKSVVITSLIFNGKDRAPAAMVTEEIGQVLLKSMQVHF